MKRVLVALVVAIAMFTTVTTVVNTSPVAAATTKAPKAPKAPIKVTPAQAEQINANALYVPGCSPFPTTLFSLLNCLRAIVNFLRTQVVGGIIGLIGGILPSGSAASAAPAAKPAVAAPVAAPKPVVSKPIIPTFRTRTNAPTFKLPVLGKLKFFNASEVSDNSSPVSTTDIATVGSLAGLAALAFLARRRQTAAALAA